MFLPIFTGDSSRTFDSLLTRVESDDPVGLALTNALSEQRLFNISVIKIQETIKEVFSYVVLDLIMYQGNGLLRAFF